MSKITKTTIGQLKEIIKDIPDDYSIWIDVAVHVDDLSDVLAENLVIHETDKNDAGKDFYIRAGLAPYISQPK